MVDKYTTSKSGKEWSFTLRPGLKFSDGAPVTSADAIASLQRWGAKDSLGRALGAAGADWNAISADTFSLTLKEPFGIFPTFAGEFDLNSPISNVFLGAACGNSMPGWPCDKALDELRTSWGKEAVASKRRIVLDAFQIHAYETVPYVNAGQYSAAFAARSSIKGLEKMWAGLPTVWMLDR